MRLTAFVFTAVLAAPALCFAVVADKSFEFSHFPSVDGAGVWTSRSNGTMATGAGAVQNPGTITYPKGASYDMATVNNPASDGTLDTLYNTLNWTVEARFKITNFDNPGAIDFPVAIENNTLGSNHGNFGYGQRTAPAIPEPVVHTEISSPGPNNQFSFAGPGAGVNLTQGDWVTVRITSTYAANPATDSVRVTFLEGQPGASLATPVAGGQIGVPSPPGATRSRGLIIRKNASADVEFDYIRIVKGAVADGVAITAIPEPSSALLLSLAGLAGLVRRRNG